MMKISTLYPSKWLTADDLGDRDWSLKIDRLALEEMGHPPEEKPVLYFVGAHKGLILNRTNGKAIAGIWGDEADNWPGKPVTLYTTWIKVAGQQHHVIRVRPKQTEPDLDDIEDVADPDPDLWEVTDADVGPA